MIQHPISALPFGAFAGLSLVICRVIGYKQGKPIVTNLSKGMVHVKRQLLTMIICLTAACAAAASVKLHYPETERIAHVDTYHDIAIHDPYRWLEEDARHSGRVAQWVAAQNELTFGYLKALPQREPILQRLTTLWDYEKLGIPWKIADRYFVFHNDGLQNHAVLYTMTTPDGPRTVLFNPNDWSADGTVALASVSISPDGQYAAYAIQEAGSDWRTWKIRHIDSRKDCTETFNYLKFTSMAWTADSRGLYYSKYPEPTPEQQFTALNKDMKVYYHRLGADPAEDRMIYARPDEPDWSFSANTTEDGQYLIITTRIGTDPKHRITYIDLSETGTQPIDLIDAFEYQYRFIDNDGPMFYFLTDNAAVNRRVIAIDIRQPFPENWRTIVPEAKAPLTWINRLSARFVCGYLEDVTTCIRFYGTDGVPIPTPEFPALGTISGFSGKNSDTETFYSYQSLTTPPTIYRYDLQTDRSTRLAVTKVDFDADQYVAKQVFYTSKDGTRIPMFITYKKGITLDGSNPTLLYGYGGFDTSLRPSFSASRAVWMEMGGVYAIANLRGGGEYGRTWHESGKRMNKQNVFDDFIAAGEYLIDQQYTSNKKLGIMGGSNGGLLVGACMTQRPDLFAAAVPQVGVMDMLRYDQFTAGRFWVDEYGSAQESRAMFEYLKSYSPYHNLRKAAYPATLIVTADTDDRVVPGHSFKFVAELQRVQQGSNPVLIRIETRAGHGSGKPISMALQEVADIYAFLAENLDMSDPSCP